MQTQRKSCWFLLLLLLAATSAATALARRDAFITKQSLGWTLRGGGNNNEQSSSEYDSEWEEESTTATVAEDTANTNDEDIDESEDLEMFFDAQEFVDEEEGASAVKHEEIVKDKDVVVEEESASFDNPDDDFQQEEEEDDFQIVDEDTTPETDFEKQLSQQEDTPSTEDASQVETDVEVIAGDHRISQSSEEVSAEFVDEPSLMEEEGSVQESAAAVEIVETEAREEDTAFASQTAGNLPTEVDLSQQHTTDDDSMAFVDRMELADDEGEAVLNGFPEEEGIVETREESVLNDVVAAEKATLVAAVTNDDEAAVETPTTATENGDNEVAVESVSTVLNDETKEVLIKELKFHRREVNQMKPEIAVVLAEKRLRRPCEGVPSGWFADDAKKPVTRQKHRIVKIMLFPIAYAAPIALGALAIYGSANVSNMLSSISSSSGRVASRESHDTTEQVVDSTPMVSEVEDSPQQPSDNDGGGGGIPPFDEHSRIPKKEKDESWVDKVITGIAKPLKAFWDIKI